MAKRKRPVDGMQRRYEWRLYPTPEQMAALREQAAMCADLWNALLSMCECTREFRIWYYTQKGPAFFDINGNLHVLRLSEVWKRRRMFGARIRASDILGSRAECVDLPIDAQRRFLPSKLDMGYWITEMLADCSEWRALSTWTPRRIATSLSGAWKAFFRRVKAGEKAGYPRYKSCQRADSVPHRCLSGCKIIKSEHHKTSWILRLKGVPGDIHARGGTRHHGVGDMETMINEWTDADIQLDDRGGKISIAVAIDERRQSCEPLHPVTVRFDLLDGFVLVNDEIVTPSDLIRVKDLDDRRAAMQADFDLQWPRGKRWSDEEWQERCERRAEISRLASRMVRIRRNALHVWTCNLVESASVLTIHKPRIKDNTKTPRGNAKKWGAAVEMASNLNRNTLSYAPATAAQMLEYKAREIGIRCEVIEDRAPNIEMGGKMVTAQKQVRQDRRDIKKAAMDEKRKKDKDNRRKDRPSAGTDHED